MRELKSPLLIRIANATFYRSQPTHLAREPLVASTASTISPSGPIAQDDTRTLGAADLNPPLFPDLEFYVGSRKNSRGTHWAIVSPSSGSRTTFLQILRGQHLCFPPTARSYPYLSTNHVPHKDANKLIPSRAIQYVGFDAERGGANSTIRGAYMSARYESRREVGDFSVKDYLLGNTELNADDSWQSSRFSDNAKLLGRVTRNLRLDSLLDMPVTQLSNGQTRRARIAKALLDEPELLLLDGPFMGLDPPTVFMLSDLLHDMSSKISPRVLLSLSPGEHLPDWITHVAITDEKYRLYAADSRNKVIKRVKEAAILTAPEPDAEPSEEHRLAIALEPLVKSGLKSDLVAVREGLQQIDAARRKGLSISEMLYHRKARRHMSRDGFPMIDPVMDESGETVVEMDGVCVRYGDKVVLGHNTGDQTGVTWRVRRGERWGVFGANGSGKTTLLSLILSDHPQTYSQPVRLFGRSRLPEAGKPGISIFDIQARIGHSSPEVHSFFPRHLTVRRALESAWADTPITKPRLTSEADMRVDRALLWFQAELNPSLGHRPLIEDEHNRSMFWDKKWVDMRAHPDPMSPASQEAVISELETRKSKLKDIKKAWVEEDTFYTPTWADELKFGELNFSAQRVILFLRAILKQPDLIVLDEAFSGMDTFTKAKCQLYLSHGENMMLRLYNVDATKTLNKDGPMPAPSMLARLGLVQFSGLTKDQALIVVSHRPDEVPGCVRDWLCLQQPDEGPMRIGQLLGPLSISDYGWSAIWNPNATPPASVDEWLELHPQANYRSPAEHKKSVPTTPEDIAEDKRLSEDLRARIEALRSNYVSIISSDATPSSDKRWRLSSRDLAALFGTKDHTAVHNFIIGSTGSREIGYRWAKAYFDKLDGIEPEPKDDDAFSGPGRPVLDIFAPENRIELRRKLLANQKEQVPGHTVLSLRDIRKMTRRLQEKEGRSEEEASKTISASGP